MIYYDKLWYLLLKKNITKTELRNQVGMSSSTLAKMGKNEQVNLDILVRICEVLECDIGDIISTSPNSIEVYYEKRV